MKIKKSYVVAHFDIYTFVQTNIWSTYIENSTIHTQKNNLFSFVSTQLSCTPLLHATSRFPANGQSNRTVCLHILYPPFLRNYTVTIAYSHSHNFLCNVIANRNFTYIAILVTGGKNIVSCMHILSYSQYETVRELL